MKVFYCETFVVYGKSVTQCPLGSGGTSHAGFREPDRQFTGFTGYRCVVYIKGPMYHNVIVRWNKNEL